MKKKLLVLLLCMLLGVGLAAGCSNGNQTPPPEEPETGTETPVTELETLVVGATAVPHAEILEVVKPLLAEEGIDLQIKEFTDYVLLNPAVSDGSVDANFFQHVPYLEDYNIKNNDTLVWTVMVHVEPMGVYSNTLTDINDIGEGAKVAVPNDESNCARALMVLESAGLIQLDPDAPKYQLTDADIIENPKNLEVQMMDAAMLPRTLDEVALCVINSNYALDAGLNPSSDAIYMEAKDSPYANVLAVRAADVEKDAIKQLGAALNSETVRTYLLENYPDSCIPSF